MAGASAISIGTANFGDPTAVVRIKRELFDLLKERKFNSVAAAVGVAHEK
jgi:dihydroorotate dehydrogenase (NAD+) catalytic subunit